MARGLFASDIFQKRNYHRSGIDNQNLIITPCPEEVLFKYYITFSQDCQVKIVLKLKFIIFYSP